MTQFPLPLSYKAADGERDFFVSEANAHAVAYLDRWPDWPRAVALLLGPAGSGKSHLGRIFARQTGAEVIDDLDRAIDDEAVFHSWNRADEARPLLLIARTPPSAWGVALPDLRSRLAATPQIAIQAPDDALLAAVLAKQFRDRGLKVAPDVVAYVTARMERSFGEVAQIVDRLDAASLAQGRAITVPLARAVLPEQLDWLEI
jgi:chromosomal replication initiation ATPase DnaA